MSASARFSNELRYRDGDHHASHPSALLGWNVGLEACSALGWRVRGAV